MDVQPKQTPLPTLQLAILLFIQSTEPITATVIYPFIPELVRSTGITGGDETKTGYYAGIIVRDALFIPGFYIDIRSRLIGILFFRF